MVGLDWRWTVALVCAATPSAAQVRAPAGELSVEQARVIAGLEAQFQAALIRERRLADDRENRLLDEGEARLARARAAADAAAGEASEVEAELDAARRDFANLTESIAQRDALFQAQLAAYRSEAADMVVRSTPERLAALQRFADGDRVGAWPVIEDLTQASVRARLSAAEQASEADSAEVERLRDEMQAGVEQ